MARVALAAALLVPLLVAGCSGPAEAPWPGRDLTETDPAWQSRTVEPGAILEIDVPLQAGDGMAWDWFTAERAKVWFSVHSHEGGQEKIHFEGERTDHKGSHTAATTNYYSLFWRNTQDGPVTLWHRTPESGMATYFPPG